MKTFIYICLLVIGLVFPAGAQVPIQSYRGQVSLKQNRIEREGNSLRLDLTISVCGLSVGRYQTLSLMPMLRSHGPGSTKRGKQAKNVRPYLSFRRQESRRWRRLYGNQEHPGTDPRNPL